MKEEYFKELHLNIKHQNIDIEEYPMVGYLVDDNISIVVIMLNLKGIKLGKS